MHTIHVQGFEPFQAAPDTKLVLAIEKHGIDISHRCGGNARCTTCRVRFNSAEPPMGTVEKDCLTEDGLMGQCRLSCQIIVDRDMDIEVLMRASEQGWEPGPEVEP